VDEILAFALRLLRARDFTVSKLRGRVESRFGSCPDELLELLLKKNFLNDRRFAENFIARRKHRGRAQLEQDLAAQGVAKDLLEQVLSETEWPSLRDALAAKMNGLRLRAPLQSRDAARLFRALLRLGYDEDAIREEIENIHEQQ
jgi:SOS response regulatory protein OraA/RecX